jgi:hypothetical protein
LFLYVFVLVAAFAVFASPRNRPVRSTWGWFVVWAAAGWLFAFSLLTGFSIGPLVLPFAAGALLFAAARAPRLASLGVVAGIGATALLVAIVNWENVPCDGGPLHVQLPAGAPPGTSVSCGGLDPTPWLVAGLLVVTVAVGANAVAARPRPA